MFILISFREQWLSFSMCEWSSHLFHCKLKVYLSIIHTIFCIKVLTFSSYMAQQKNKLCHPFPSYKWIRANYFNFLYLKRIHVRLTFAVYLSYLLIYLCPAHTPLTLPLRSLPDHVRVMRGYKRYDETDWWIDIWLLGNLKYQRALLLPPLSQPPFCRCVQLLIKSAMRISGSFLSSCLLGKKCQSQLRIHTLPASSIPAGSNLHTGRKRRTLSISSLFLFFWFEVESTKYEN